MKMVFLFKPAKKNRSKLVKFLWIQFDFLKKVIPFCFRVKKWIYKGFRIF